MFEREPVGPIRGALSRDLNVGHDAGSFPVPPGDRADSAGGAGARQVRGGTEQYYRRAARILHFADEHSASILPTTFRAIADEIASAAPDPFLVLRNIRLTHAQAEHIVGVLTELAHDTKEAGEDQPRYGMLLGLYRQASPPAAEPSP